MRRSALLPTFLLILTFVGAKSVLAWPFIHSLADLPKLIGISAEDIAVAILVGAIASIALRLTAARPKLHRAVWGAFILIATLAAIYAVANVGVFHAIGYPLNARMF